MASGSPNNAVRQAKLTPEQIQNWRKVLCVTIGPYALIMPDSEVQRMRDAMQSKFGEESTPVSKGNASTTTETSNQQGKWDEKREHEKDLEHESRMDYESDQLAGNPPEYDT